MNKKTLSNLNFKKKSTKHNQKKKTGINTAKGCLRADLVIECTSEKYKFILDLEIHNYKTPEDLFNSMFKYCNSLIYRYNLGVKGVGIFNRTFEHTMPNLNVCLYKTIGNIYQQEPEGSKYHFKIDIIDLKYLNEYKNISSLAYNWLNLFGVKHWCNQYNIRESKYSKYKNLRVYKIFYPMCTDDNIKKAIYYLSNMNPNELEEIERSIELMNDILKDEFIKGREEGRKEGRKEGREEGIEEGREETKVKAIKRLLDKIDEKLLCDIFEVNSSYINNVKRMKI